VSALRDVLEQRAERAAAQQWHRVDGWRFERLLLAEEGVIGFPALLRVTPRLTWHPGTPERPLGHRDLTEWHAEVTVMFPGGGHCSGSAFGEAQQVFADVDEAKRWAEEVAKKLATARARSVALQLMDAMKRVERERARKEEPWSPSF
jgi:hypothetical protein